MATASWQQLIQNAEEGGVSFDPLPIGEYLVEANSVEYKAASTGKDMYVVKYKVLSGPYANRTVFDNIVLTVDNPNALAYFFKDMKAFGLDKAFFASEPQPSQVAAAMEGRQLRITVNQKEYPKGSGQMKNEVDSIFATDGAAAPQQQFAQPQPQGIPPVQPQAQQFVPQQAQPQQFPQPVPVQQPVQQPDPVQYAQPPVQQQAPVAQPPVEVQPQAPAQVVQQPVAQQQQPGVQPIAPPAPPSW